MSHQQLDTAKEQLVHMATATVVFLVLALLAVGLDLLTGVFAKLGASTFTLNVLSFTTHAMLCVDTVLFLVHLAKASVLFVRGLWK